jgi:hypothetical protein
MLLICYFQQACREFERSLVVQRKDLTCDAIVLQFVSCVSETLSGITIIVSKYIAEEDEILLMQKMFNKVLFVIFKIYVDIAVATNTVKVIQKLHSPQLVS